MTEKVRFWEISADQAGQRLDNYLLARLKGVPRSLIYRVIRKGEVRVNKGRARPDRKLMVGDTVRVPPVRVPGGKVAPKASDGLLAILHSAILYEDEGLMVIDKPSGLAVHGGSGVSLGLIEALRQLRPRQRFLELVHRLDRDTSGCVMVAKKRSVLTPLQDALRDAGSIEKSYLALVEGRWPNRRHMVDAPLRRDELRAGERIVRVDVTGKPSRTAFRVVRRFADATLVEARPVTGRTHQIRVHALTAGHPLAGDDKYGGKAFNAAMRDLGLKRLFLHAFSLRVPYPARDDTFYVQAPLPTDLEETLVRLREMSD